MDIRFLQSLISVIETGSIAAAARREKLTAAAISQRIQALERSLDQPLLNRSAHAAVPTEACLRLLPRMRLLVSEARQLKSDLNGDLLSGEISIGAISTALTSIIPDILEEISTIAPALKLQLVPGSSQFLYEQLLRGQLDAAFLVRPPFAVPKSLRIHTVRRERLMLMTRDPVSGPEDIRLLIQARALIRYDPNSWGGRLATEYLEHVGLCPDVLCDMDALETITILVARGLGNSIVPAWPGSDSNGIYLTPLPEADAFQRQVVFMSAAVPSRLNALALIANILARNQSMATEEVLA